MFSSPLNRRRFIRDTGKMTAVGVAIRAGALIITWPEQVNISGVWMRFRARPTRSMSPWWKNRSTSYAKAFRD
jgi:hypothetical protein